MAAFEYRQAEDIRDALARYGVQYLFIGKSGAILLGYPDTTQGADLYVMKSPENGRAVVYALRDLGFSLDSRHVQDIERGRAFVQLKDGPFDLNLLFAPDGIERFEDAWRRHVDVAGFPVCHPDDIIASKASSQRKGHAQRPNRAYRGSGDRDPRPANRVNRARPNVGTGPGSRVHTA